MNTVVFDVAATTGGALSILEEYYTRAVEDPDRSNTWHFVVSLPELRETNTVKVLRFPWVKKSWFHRLYFDEVVAPRIVTSCRAGMVLSLQDTAIPRTMVPQTLYVHQALPFAGIRFGLWENWRYWVYQNIIGRRIIKSIKRVDSVILQSNWMKRACIIHAGVSPDKLTVSAPTIHAHLSQRFVANDDSLRTFFYPASGEVHKNHKTLLDAAALLKARGIGDRRIVVTLEGNENRMITGLYRKAKEAELPLEFVGELSREEVFGYYSRSILVFPSYIESFGLPLLEAKLHGTPVIASDCPFSHEILDGYRRARFFEQDDADRLARLMERSDSLLEEEGADRET